MLLIYMCGRCAGFGKIVYGNWAVVSNCNSKTQHRKKTVTTGSHFQIQRFLPNKSQHYGVKAKNTHVLNETLKMAHRRSRYFLFLWCKLKLIVEVFSTFLGRKQQSVVFAAVVSRTTATRVSVNDFLWKRQTLLCLLLISICLVLALLEQQKLLRNNVQLCFAVYKKPQARNGERKRSGRLWKICRITQSKCFKATNGTLGFIGKKYDPGCLVGVF